jgi:C4-dicarboxylate transporter DctM subunit
VPTVLVATAVLLLLLAAGVWVAIGLGVASIVGLYPVLGYDRLVSMIGKMMWQQNTSFVLVALPLFIFMGEVLFRGGTMVRMYSAASTLVASLPGGLLQTNIAASTLFAACTGSSLASAATIGAVGYPEIARRAYDRRLGLGSIAAGGTLGILIPPSIIFIIYGSIAEVSITRLFLAGLLPGLLMAGVFSIYIAVRAWGRPDLAPREPRPSGRQVLSALVQLWPIFGLALIILGGLYGGIATPTEVAALGAAAAIALAAIGGSLSWLVLKEAALNSVRQTSAILLIVTAAKLLSQVFVYYDVGPAMVSWIGSVAVEPMSVVIVALLIYVALGLFFEGASMMVITVPFLVPIMTNLGVDLIWLGVLICIAIEIGLLTPPVGLNLFVLRTATGEPMSDIVAGSMPFVGLQTLVLVLILVFPAIALYLVR